MSPPCGVANANLVKRCHLRTHTRRIGDAPDSISTPSISKTALNQYCLAGPGGGPASDTSRLAQTESLKPQPLPLRTSTVERSREPMPDLGPATPDMRIFGTAAGRLPRPSCRPRFHPLLSEPYCKRRQPWCPVTARGTGIRAPGRVTGRRWIWWRGAGGQGEVQPRQQLGEGGPPLPRPGPPRTHSPRFWTAATWPGPHLMHVQVTATIPYAEFRVHPTDNIAVPHAHSPTFVVDVADEATSLDGVTRSLLPDAGLRGPNSIWNISPNPGTDTLLLQTSSTQGGPPPPPTPRVSPTSERAPHNSHVEEFSGGVAIFASPCLFHESDVLLELSVLHYSSL